MVNLSDKRDVADVIKDSEMGRLSGIVWVGGHRIFLGGKWEGQGQKRRHNS